MNSTKQIIDALQTDFFQTMPLLNKQQLEDSMKYLSEVYYNEGISLISDENYDRLRDMLAKKYGESNILFAVGSEVVKEKAKLPYYMGSMDKIKPDKNNLEGWKHSYPGNVCISDKLDGISALLVKSKGKRMLYTRGDGTIGQTITHMIPNIQIGDIPGLSQYAVRGELIVSKENYNRVKDGKRGARQMVSGLANQKTMTAERKALLSLVEFVAYEVIMPENLKPSEQFHLFDTQSTFRTARWEVMDDISIEKLGTILSDRKTSTQYDIDGIIVAHDAVYPRIVGRNPAHAFAFKMSFAEQTAITEVLKVDWEASKHGYLKPTVNFEPVNIGGSIIQYASGFNASFIHTHGIGPGAFLEIIRSGDVIPYIREVKSVSPTGPQMPEEAWHWNETHVDAILDKISGNPDVQQRTILFFANTLDIGSCGEGTVHKLHMAGIHTIPEFLTITEEFLLQKVDGFGRVSAKKLFANIQAAKEKATIAQWAVASGIFGRGMGLRRIEPAFTVVPRDLHPSHELIETIAELPSWSYDSAKIFVEKLEKFKNFLQTIGVTVQIPSPVVHNEIVNGRCKDMVVLFTGFREKELEDWIRKEGGVVSDSLNKKVTLLLIKDAGVKNEKVKKALALGIQVMVVDDFRKRMNL